MNGLDHPVLAAAKAAHDANRPLTASEFQDVRNMLNDDTSSNVLIRGALRELSVAIERQSNERMRQQEADQLAAEGRRFEAMAAERHQTWREVSDRWTKAFFIALEKAPRNEALQALQAAYESAGDPNTPTPQRWRMDLLHPAHRERMFGG